MLSFFVPKGSETEDCVQETINMATQCVRNMLSENGSSLVKICSSIEGAKNKNDLKMAFDLLNEIMWTMSLIAPLTEQNGIISLALKELQFSKKFESYLKSAPTPHQAIRDYKRAVVQELAEQHLKLEHFQRCNKTFEDFLFEKYFPSTFFKSSEVEGTMQGQLTDLCESILSPCRKRSFCKCAEGGTVQYKEMCPESNSSKTEFLVEKVSSPSKRRRYENLSDKGRYSKFQ